MSKIVAKLNLNKTPQLVENNSLVMAKNVKVLKDGTIGVDTSLDTVAIGPVIAHTHNAVDPTRDTETIIYLISIHSPNYYDRRSPSNTYLTIDDVEYNKHEYTPEEDEIEIEGDFYTFITDELIYGDIYTFDINENRLVYTFNHNDYTFLYLIEEDAYTGASTFSMLSAYGITPYFYCVGKTSDVGKVVIIANARYIVVDPTFFDKYVRTEHPSQSVPYTITTYDPARYVGQIVGLENKVYIFREATSQEFTDAGLNYPTDDLEKVRIFEYDEVSGTSLLLKCGWRYSGGKIDGNVTVNNTNEKILTICEYDSIKDVPIKHINLEYINENDDQSLYTQNPNIGFTNITLLGLYNKIIPSGVYQFFVRYKIREGFYTDWFPASEELFTTTQTITKTIQGELGYVDKHRQSPKSFKLLVNHSRYNSTKNNFKEYQIGFIISSEDSVVARGWKSFPYTNTSNTVYFDYEKNSIEEVNIDDMLKTTYELFNVKNITVYKNKQYISNYKETDFNSDELVKYAKNINVTLNRESVPIQDNSNILVFGKLLSKSDDSLDYYDIWDGRPISDLFFELINKNKTFVSNTSSDINYYNGTNDALKVNLYWKKGQDITGANEHKRDIYWIAGSEKKLSFNVDSQQISFTDFSRNADNPFDAGFADIPPGIDSYNNYTINGILYTLFRDVYGNPAINDIQGLRHNWYWIGGRAANDIHTGNPIMHCYRQGLYGTESRAEAHWKNLYEGAINRTYPKTIIAKLSVTRASDSSTVDILTTGDPNDYIFSDNDTVINGGKYFTESYPTTSIESMCFTMLGTRVIGAKVYSNSINFVILDNDNNKVEITNFNAAFLRLNYEVTIDSDTNVVVIDKYLHVKANCEQHSFIYNCVIDSQYIDTGGVNDYEYKSLMPFTEYEFYVHYVKANGVATNGYLIGTGAVSCNTFDNSNDNINIIYPSFTNIVLPPGYVSSFISIYKTGDNIARIFNVRTYLAGNKFGKDSNYIYGDCLECDTLLYPLSKNINIYKHTTGTTFTFVSNVGEYFSSGVNQPISEFGNCGEVRWQDSGESNGASYWIKIESDTKLTKNKRLVRITPYLDSTSHVQRIGYLPGFICRAIKLNHDVNDALYISGTDIYVKDISIQDTIKLNESNGYIANSSTNYFYINSNFNLNCVNLNDDIIAQQRTFYTDPNDETTRAVQFIKAVNSLTCSSILTLAPTYYDYIRKYYSVYDENKKITVFNNTVRSSNTDSDEVYRSIYVFNSEDYYNVPSHRGIITKLFNLADSIYIHTEHSLFKFIGGNNINGEEGEITLKETDVFESGVKELFDSKNGYAGLKKKEQCLVMFDSYVFWDDYAQRLYAFGGESKFVVISDSVDKIIKEYDIIDVLFAADEQNDRFFINFVSVSSNICFSYNYKVNSIVSIHDMTFEDAFSTRMYSYFIHLDYDSNDTMIGWTIYKVVEFLEILGVTYRAAYQNCWKCSYIRTLDMLDTKQTFGTSESCVDVILNTNYEIIKNLDYVNWICNDIDNYRFASYYLAEERFNDKTGNYSGNKLRIYTDSCATDLIDLVDSDGNSLESNNERLYTLTDANPNSWQYPRYNCGIWSLNYFRNVRDVYDMFKYTNAANQITGGTGHSQTTDLIPKAQRQYLTQENNLVYGKYIVFRLIFFNRNFKFENVTFKVKDYEKVK